MVTCVDEDDVSGKAIAKEAKRKQAMMSTKDLKRFEHRVKNIRLSKCDTWQMR